MTKNRAAILLGAGLAMMLILAAVACRNADEGEEEKPANYTFVLDTPPDGASDVDPGVLLHWSVWNNMHLADEADLFFGTDPNPPVLKKITLQDSGYFRPGPLKLNQAYYWKVSVSSPPGSSKVQSFTVTRDRTIWTFPLQRGNSLYDVAGSPTVLGDRVFQRSGNDMFHCLDAATGSVLWTFNPKQAGSAAKAPHEQVEKIYFTSGKIYCLDTVSGALLWSAASAKSTLGFYQPKVLGDRVFTFTDERISCLAAANGNEVWGIDRAKCTSLDAENGRVFVTTRDANGSNSLECLDAETGSVLWSRNFGLDSYMSDTAADPQRVFIGHGNRLYCLDSRDGAPVWEYITDKYAANLFVFDNKVLLATDQDRYALLDAASGAKIWQAELLETPGRDHYTRMNGDPVLVNGSLVLADTSGYVYGLDMMDGRVFWKYFVSTDMMGVACFGKRIYVTGDDEYLYCLDTE